MQYNAILKVGVLVENRGRLLLIKERDWQDGKRHWNIIKGSFDTSQDKTILDTAIRESHEEAGIRIRVTSLLNILYLKKHGQAFIQFNFIAKLKSASRVKSNLLNVPKYKYHHDSGRNEDIIEIKFFSKPDLLEMKRQDLMGERTYVAIQDWLKGRGVDKKLLKVLKKY